MSKSRGYLTRPRTKVYDCNYDIGQQYYKSTLDSLDRKYGKVGSTETTATTNGTLASLRASLEREKQELPTKLTRQVPTRDLDDEDTFSETPRTPRTNALLNEFDSLFEGRGKLNIRVERSPNRSLKTLDDELEDDLSASLKKLRANRARAAEETQLEIRKPRQILDISADGADESHLVARRKVVKVTTSSSTEKSGDDKYTKWTAINSDDRRRHALDEEPDSAAQIAAAARARKSRARLDDLEVEMQELTDRNAAREKRVRDLKSFLKDEVNSDSVQSVKVRSSVKSEKKVVTF